VVVTSPVRIGSYRIERLLGVGSFATVWLGYDASLGARVAIKVLAENWSHDARVRERFLDEARLLWTLNDDRILAVHALGELPDGRPYFVMAWAEGGSLRDRLARGPIAARPAARLLREICAGVAVLHDHGIVHRDVTPGNVLFRSPAAQPGSPARPHRVVIADLGLAKALAAASGLTARAGTPGYMAPEQDDPFAVVDRRTDVYGLGRLGIRLLGVPAGRRPGQPVRLRAGVPPGVAAILQSATARRPADRFRDAAAMGAALERAIAGRRARPLTRAATRIAMLLVAAAAVSLSASDAVGGRFWRQPGVAVDATGRISIRLPDGWRAATVRWSGSANPGARALVVSPDPARWRTDATTPGAFLGLPGGRPANTVPAGSIPASTAPASNGPVDPAAVFVAGRPHADCVPASPRRISRAGVEWVIAAFSCADGRGDLVETAGTGPAGLVYVQITPPPGSEPTFVDTLLAGVRVH
jgi:tRNA A-37 threonylcarbamoyl transferase component Bud32